MLEASVRNLTAKILCKRHNEALSPLDAEAGRFFSVLTAALVDLERKTLSRKPIFHLISGEALELWMLKVACGSYFGVGSKDGKRLTENFAVDLAKVHRAFFEREWDPRAGLHFHGAVGTRITVSRDVVFSPLTSDSDQRFSGVTVALAGFALELLFDTTNTNPGPWTGIVRRPSELVLTRKQRRHSIILTWPPGTPEASITCSEHPPTQAGLVSTKP
jgi:hypothetical protein